MQPNAYKIANEPAVRSRNCVKVIVAAKNDGPNWLSMNYAIFTAHGTWESWSGQATTRASRMW
jgi:phosphoketolase